MAKNHNWGRRSLKRMEGIDQELKDLLYVVIKQVPFDLTIVAYGGLRTPEEQLHLFNKGATPLDGITRKSKHQSGLAVDVVPYIDGNATWRKKYTDELALYMFAEAAQQDLRIAWGGFFSWGYDGCHYHLL